MFTGTGTLPDYTTGYVSLFSMLLECSPSLKMGSCSIHLRDIPSTTHPFLPLLHVILNQTDFFFQVPSDWTAGRIWVRRWMR